MNKNQSKFWKKNSDWKINKWWLGENEERRKKNSPWTSIIMMIMGQVYEFFFCFSLNEKKNDNDDDR